jgi:hypothetical protein
MLLDSEDDDADEADPETISPDEWAQLSELSAHPVRARVNIVLKGSPTGRKGSIASKADSTANSFVPDEISSPEPAGPAVERSGAGQRKEAGKKKKKKKKRRSDGSKSAAGPTEKKSPHSGKQSPQGDDSDVSQSEAVQAIGQDEV